MGETLSKATIYRLLERGEFPLRVQFSPRCVSWRVSDVDEWFEKRLSVADAAVPGEVRASG